MSETRTRDRNTPAMRDPFRDSLEESAQHGAGSDMLPVLTPRAGGAATDQALANFVTAQRVAVKRNLADVLRDVKALGSAAGAEFYYRIPFKSRDKATGETTTTWVEGPSIDCAMAVASAYGNCRVGATVVREAQDSWLFAATFQDLEKGVTVIREFLQRKGQNTGMRDAGRQLDIVFQIGQSKAIRNVVVAAIPTVVNEAYLAAKDSILTRVEKQPDRFRAWLGDVIDGLRLQLPAIERAVATKYDDWTPNQMAKLYADLKAVKDGMVAAEDLWPGSANGGATPGVETVSENAAAEGALRQDPDGEQQQAKPASDLPPKERRQRQPAAEKAKPAPAPTEAAKQAPQPAPEPEPEAEQAEEEAPQDGEGEPGPVEPEPASAPRRQPPPDYNFGA